MLPALCPDQRQQHVTGGDGVWAWPDHRAIVTAAFIAADTAVALLTEKIRDLQAHFNVHKKDNHSMR
jgi:ribosomal protein S15P/S13E